MGNRAVITNWVNGETEETFNNFLETGIGTRKEDNEIGIYLHWNGGRDSVEAFLMYCKIRGFRPTNMDNYGWARLTQIIANFFGGELCIGISTVKGLDCNNYDNGVYLIENWEIKGRYFINWPEQDEYELREMLFTIDESQPTKDQVGRQRIIEFLEEQEKEERNE